LSRGIGRVQQKVIAELQQAPAGTLLSWNELKQRHPREAAQGSLHRAIRRLRERGLVYEHHFGERRYLALSVRGNAELRKSVDYALWLLKAACRARGVPLPDLADPSWKERLDAYRPGRKVSD
jgi:hypothetical protein